MNGADRSIAGGVDGAPVVVKESVEVMETKFEEWMKLATDNVSSPPSPSLPFLFRARFLRPSDLIEADFYAWLLLGS